MKGSCDWRGHWSCIVVLAPYVDDSLLPSLRPTPDGSSEAPWSITQRAAMFCERAVNLLPPSARPTECQTHFSFPVRPFFPGLLLYWNNWAAFSATRLSVHLLNRDIKSGATVSLWPSFHGSFLRPLAHLPARSRWVIIMTPAWPAQWHDIHGTLSTVCQLVWSSVYRPFFPAPLSPGSLDRACSTWHTFKMATSRGFYSSTRIQSLVFLPLCWVIQSLMSEGNKGKLMVCWMMERLPFCFCWRSHTASVHVKWVFFFCSSSL